MKIEAPADYYEVKEIKMTREEARLKVFAACKNLEGRECAYFIEGLEALGLIKFDEKTERQKLIEEAEEYLKSDKGNYRYLIARLAEQLK